MNHTIKATAIAIGIFLLAMMVDIGLRMAAPAAVEAHPWLEQFALKTALAGLSLVAMRLFTGGLRPSGFQRPTKKVRWLPVWAPALGMGALATVLVLGAGKHGLNSIFASYGFAGIVFWVWFYSSVTEEIFVRGWFQTYVAQGAGPEVAASALLFGAMHIGLIRKVDPWSVTVIVCCAILLGWIAAKLRREYASLLPAIVAHMSFNVGGAVGGILFAIVYRIRTGHLPLQ